MRTIYITACTIKILGTNMKAIFQCISTVEIILAERRPQQNRQCPMPCSLLDRQTKSVAHSGHENEYFPYHKSLRHLSINLSAVAFNKYHPFGNLNNIIGKSRFGYKSPKTNAQTTLKKINFDISILEHQELILQPPFSKKNLHHMPHYTIAHKRTKCAKNDTGNKKKITNQTPFKEFLLTLQPIFNLTDR